MSTLVNRCTSAADASLRPSGAPAPQPPTAKRHHGQPMDDSTATAAATATGLFLSLAPCVDAACRASPIKKPRFNNTAPPAAATNQSPAPFFLFHPSSSSSESCSSASTVTTTGSAKAAAAATAAKSSVSHSQPQSLDALPDECLYEILRRLSAKQDRTAAACVSRRWLLLLSSIRAADIEQEESADEDDDASNPQLQASSSSLQKQLLPDLNEDPSATPTPELARCLEGKDATDARLAAMAIRAGTALGKLSIRSSSTSCTVTDVGLKAVARCCPSLRALVLWDVPFIGDDGLVEIAEGCPFLEKLDLCQCPLVTDRGIAAIAEKCPNLNTVTLESCSGVSDEALAAVGAKCQRIQSVSITACPLVGDSGVCRLMCSASASIKKVKLDSLAVTDYTLGVVGYYGREVTDLVLSGLQSVGEKGFWVMGTAKGLRSLTSFTAIACEGLTDLGLEAVVKGCPALKQLCLKRCASLSDNGLKSSSASGAAKALETLRLDECNSVTLPGLLAALGKCTNLKALSLSRCTGIKEPANAAATPFLMTVSTASTTTHTAASQLRSLTIRSCPGIRSAGMAMISTYCPNIQHLDLRGLPGVTDAGFLKLVEACQPGLVKVNLSGCSGLSDAVVSSLTKIHGATLQVLNLSGCGLVTDVSLFAIAQNCTALADLDVSGSAVTDAGVAALASARLSVKVLSLARCTKITTRSLAFLCNLGRSLKGLSVQNCGLISSAAVSALVEKMWWCDILY